MNKLYILVVTFVLILTGCTGVTPEELAMSSQFGVTFDELNKEELTASFTVEGLPNDEEFEQIPTIITDSLTAQELEGVYTVEVYSSIQEVEDAPYFGTLSYTDGELDNANLVNITMDEYLNNTTTEATDEAADTEDATTDEAADTEESTDETADSETVSEDEETQEEA